MKSIFETHPDISISADVDKLSYNIKYTECLEERGTIRFFRKSKVIPKDKIMEKLELLFLSIIKD